MRTFIALALVSWMIGEHSAFASDIELELDFRDAAGADMGIGDVPEEASPLAEPWSLKGVEEAVVFGNDCSGWTLRKRETSPAISREQIFTGMWTSTAPSRFRDWRCGEVDLTPPPSALPPFNERWLRNDLWPRTKSYLDGDAADVQAFNIVLANDG